MWASSSTSPVLSRPRCLNATNALKPAQRWSLNNHAKDFGCSSIACVLWLRSSTSTYSLPHTGHYHLALVEYLQEFDLPIYIMPVQKRPLGMLKSDKRDALGLA